eukprot:gene1567-1907_t
MGFQEGARRNVKCDGGYVTGLDAYMGGANSFTEKTIVALRVKCSSGKIIVEFTKGSLPDTAVFGNLEQRLKPKSGLGIAAIEWRRGASAEKDNTARVGGFRIHCNSE